MRTALLKALVLTAAATLTAAGALADDYPRRSIVMVVPFSAGGPTDTLGRILAERMGRSLKQTVLVENVTGAGGTIANNKVIKAAPDGYTMMIGHIGTHVLAVPVQGLPNDYLNEFAEAKATAVSKWGFTDEPKSANVFTYGKKNNSKLSHKIGRRFSYFTTRHQSRFHCNGVREKLYRSSIH